MKKYFRIIISVSLKLLCYMPLILNASYTRNNFDSLPSVFEYAHKTAPTLSRNVHIFTATAQTNAKEKLNGRPWVSPPNVNLYSTYAVPFSVQPSKTINLEPLVATSVVQAVSSHGLNAKFKWPNDIQLNNKKIGGVGISYRETTDKSYSFVIANVNLNINMHMDDLAEIDQPATSMMLEAKQSFNKEEVLKTVTNSILSNMNDFKISNQIPHNILTYANNCLIKEKKFTALGINIATFPRVCIEGIVKGLDASGGVIINEEKTNAQGIVVRAKMTHYEREPKVEEIPPVNGEEASTIKVVEIIPPTWQLHESINSSIIANSLLEKATPVQSLIEKLNRDAHFKNISFSVNKGITSDGRGYIWISGHKAHKISIHLGEINASYNELSNSHVKVFAYNKVVDKFGKMRNFEELKEDQVILDSHIPLNVWSRWPMWFTPTLPAPIKDLEQSLIVKPANGIDFQDKGLTLPEENGLKILATPITQGVKIKLETPIAIAESQVLSIPVIEQQLEILSTPVHEDIETQILLNKEDKIEQPSLNSNWIKLKGGQGWKNQESKTIWKKDKLHKDHWDIMDLKGRKIMEVDFNGRQIWPNGPKNKNKQ